MFPVYGWRCLWSKALHNLVEKFSQGLSKFDGDIRPGRPVETAAEATVQRLEKLTRADRRITIDSVATALQCSNGFAYSIIHDRLKIRKVLARWVPREVKQ
jgi:hypothetical protein